MKNNNYICYPRYLRNSIAYHHDFWCTCAKWWYLSLGVFFSFSKFLFFGLLGRVKGQKTIQNDKKSCLLHSVSQEPYIIWLSLMVHLCIGNDNIFKCFFHFFKILIFRVVRRRLKGKKPSKMKKNSVWCTPYLRNHIIWLSFMVHICKMIISSGVFDIFLKFLFSGSLRE